MEFVNQPGSVLVFLIITFQDVSLPKCRIHFSFLPLQLR